MKMIGVEIQEPVAANYRGVQGKAFRKRSFLTLCVKKKNWLKKLEGNFNVNNLLGNI